MLQRFFVVTLLGVVASIRKLGRQEKDVGDLGASNFTPTFLKMTECSSERSAVVVHADAADAECQKICSDDTECQAYYVGGYAYQGPSHRYCRSFRKLKIRGGWPCYPKKRCSCSSPGNVVCGASFRIVSCLSSSQYSDKYACKKAYDGNANTDWATRGTGKGSWIKLNFTQKTGISQVNISQRGYNDRNRRIELKFDDGSSVFKSLSDNSSPSTITFPYVMTKEVTIEVDEIYRSKNSGFKEISFGCTGNSNEYRCNDGTKASCAPSHYCNAQTFLWGDEACQERPR